MITIKDFTECIQYKITEGSEYLWKCYGKNPYSLTYWNSGTGDDVTIFIVFDTKTQQVFEMQAWDGLNRKEYRWIHPGYIEGYAAEAKSRNVDYKQSFDNHKFIDLEVSEDMLEKATAIFSGEIYDERIMVQLDLGKHEQFMLMEMAHEADMTLNEFVEDILRRDLRKYGIEV
jgi:hypothetical protein